MKLLPELVIINQSFESKEEILRELGGRLLSLGLVKDSFINAVIEREKNYATGLQAEVMALAIPHTDRKHVNESAIAFASLSSPIRWGEMATESDEVNAEIVIMLAVGEGGDHLETLMNVIDIVSEADILSALKQATSPQEIIRILKESIGGK